MPQSPVMSEFRHYPISRGPKGLSSAGLSGPPGNARGCGLPVDE